MKDSILLELASRWEREANVLHVHDTANFESADIRNAVAMGERMAKRECADALRMLVQLLGENNQ